MFVILPPLHARSGLHLHHGGVGHAGHSIRVLRIKVPHDLGHIITTQTLLVAHGAILMLQKQSFELDNLFPQLTALLR